MTNGDQQQMNCVLEVCCGGDDGEKRVRAMGQLLQHALGEGPYAQVEVATWIVDTFDLADKGTLLAFKDSIAKLARSFPYEG